MRQVLPRLALRMANAYPSDFCNQLTDANMIAVQKSLSIKKILHIRNKGPRRIPRLICQFIPEGTWALKA
eukprot:scaffold279606_cov18-Prasinocladus_malaysianus.AAC.1